MRSELRPVVAVATNVRDRVSSDAMKCSITMRINETLATVGKATMKSPTRGGADFDTFDGGSSPAKKVGVWLCLH